jgi:hypothetical protein
MSKFKIKPFDRYVESTSDNLEKLNSIRSLYDAYKDLGLFSDESAQEFYGAVGAVLIGFRLDDLELRYIEFER